MKYFVYVLICGEEFTRFFLIKIKYYICNTFETNKIGVTTVYTKSIKIPISFKVRWKGSKDARKIGKRQSLKVSRCFM